MNMYRTLPSIDHTMNPLIWWKDNQRLYPSLSKLARKVLSIPSTSAASERVFSTGTETSSDLIFLKGSWESVQEFINAQEKLESKKRKRGNDLEK